MKKNIDLIIVSIFCIILILISIIFIKPNTLYYVEFDGVIYFSTDNKTFSYENNVIEYERLENTVIITTHDNTVIKYFHESKRIIIDLASELKILSATIDETVINYNTKDVEDIRTINQYIPIINTSGPINNDKINVNVQKVISGFMAVIISFCFLFIINQDRLEKISKKHPILYLSGNLILFALSLTIYLLFLII